LSCSKEFSQRILSGSLKATKVKMLGKKDLQDSTWFGYKNEFKIGAN